MRSIPRFLAAWLLVVAACSQGEATNAQPEHGRALRTSVAHHTFGWNVAPRQETINKVTAVINRSDKDVILRDIKVRTRGGVQRYGRIVRVLVSSPGAGGTFWTIPLVTKFEDEGPCDVQRLKKTDGYTIAPGERVDIAIWVRPLRAGKFKAGPIEISYEQEGKDYFQIDTYWIEVTVERNRSRKPPKDVRECAHLAKLLPGNSME